jgi:hypothetical protein
VLRDQPALVMLSVDGCLPVFLAWTTPNAVLVLGVGALIRQQRAPPSSTSHPSRIATDSPMTSASRSRP